MAENGLRVCPEGEVREVSYNTQRFNIIILETFSTSP